jgi:anti-sigma-K factor RskA
MKTRDDDITLPDEDAPPLAAEFVLGLVQGFERDALEKRRRDDYVFAREVEFWEARLGPISGDVKPEAVSPHVWEKIAQEVGHKPIPLSASKAGKDEGGLWNSLPFWRSLGLAGPALAAASLVFAMAGLVSPPPSLVATLTLTDGKYAFMASVDRMTGKVMLMPAADMPAPADHTHELWIVPVGGTPRSLGTFVADAPIMIKMPRETMPGADAEAMLAISVEPMGGSKTGAPTGPVVASGKMHEL